MSDDDLQVLNGDDAEADQGGEGGSAARRHGLRLSGSVSPTIPSLNVSIGQCARGCRKSPHWAGFERVRGFVLNGGDGGFVFRHCAPSVSAAGPDLPSVPAAPPSPVIP